MPPPPPQPVDLSASLMCSLFPSFELRLKFRHIFLEPHHPILLLPHVEYILVFVHHDLQPTLGSGKQITQPPPDGRKLRLAAMDEPMETPKEQGRYGATARRCTCEQFIVALCVELSHHISPPLLGWRTDFKRRHRTGRDSLGSLMQHAARIRSKAGWPRSGCDVDGTVMPLSAIGPVCALQRGTPRL